MYTYQQKVNHLKMLYHAANSDGSYKKSEKIFIRRVAENLGIDIKELENIDFKDFDLILPEKEYLLYSLFHRLALVMLVDSEMNGSERHFCLDMGVRMGLHPQSVNEVLDHIISNGAFEASPSSIIEIFKKYSN